MTAVVYLRAAEWGFRGTPRAEAKPDAECFVHHTGSELRGTAAECFRALDAYAINVKGYSGGLDYDVLVHYDPTLDVVTVGEGRGPYMSAATLDRNEQGEAVCIVGNFEVRQPHPAEIEGVALGIKYGIDNGWIARDAQILGHRDNPAHPGATACPGRHLYAHLPAIRTRVAALLNPPPAQEDPMKVIRHGRHGATYVTNGMTKTWLNEGLAAAVAIARFGGIEDVDEVTCASYGPILGPVPANHDAYGRVIG
jgi:hypothetical protein